MSTCIPVTCCGVLPRFLVTAAAKSTAPMSGLLDPPLVSPPTEANNATRATNGNPPTRPLYKNLTNTPHRTLCHRGTRHRHRGAAPTAGATGTCAAHTQLKPGRRGNPPAPMMKPRHGCVGALGRNKQNGRNLRRSKPRTQLHAHTYHLNRPGRPRQGGARPAHTRPRGWEVTKVDATSETARRKRRECCGAMTGIDQG